MLFRPSAVRATLLLAAMVAALLSALALPAHGHVHVVGTFPADGETLAVSPTELVVAFDDVIDVPRNGMQLFVNDVEVPLESFVTGDGMEARAIVPDEGQVPGTHRVAFRVVSPDAHVIEGEFAYLVTEPVGDDEPGASDGGAEDVTGGDDPAVGATEAGADDDAASGESARSGTTDATAEAMDPATDAGRNTGLLTVLGVLMIAGIVAVLLLRPRGGRDSA